MTPPFTPGLHDGPLWRAGGKNPHVLYRQLGAEPDRRPWPDGDPCIGSLFHPDHVKRAVEAVNLVRAGLCGEMDVLRVELNRVTAERDNLLAQNERLAAQVVDTMEDQGRRRRP